MDDKKRLESIERQLKVIPDKPGVYVIYDDNDRVIYVGKAKSLINRLRSHFAPSTDFSKSRVIRERAVRIEVHQVKTENEALLLEYNMIQEHQPPLNEKWKDGKTYPYVEFTMGEEYPRVVITREKNNSDSIYLGPYSDVGAVRRSLRYVLKFFPIADCNKEIHLGDADSWAKTCIRRRTNQCLKPCEVPVDHDEYIEQVDQVIKFLEGKHPEIISQLEKQMKDAAGKLEFEKAAKYRDTIKSIRRTMQRQQVFLDEVQDCLVLVEVANSTETCFTIQKIEDKRIVRRDSNTLPNIQVDENRLDFISSFLITIFELSQNKRPSVTVIVDTKKKEEVMKLLQSLGYQPKIPETDIEKQLVEMTKNHAKQYLQRRILMKKDRKLPTRKVLDLAEILNLDVPPYIIDTFDISTLQGTNTVASCIRFQNGQPLKKGYRKFKIKTVDHQNDFASMEEVVFRRYRDVKDGIDPNGLELPDLIVIDGGVEQLKRARNALKRIGLDIFAIGLAKREEEIYLPDSDDPIKEDKNRPGMLLLRAARDEAHRFAITYQKQLRQKSGLVSILDGIDGIGPKRKKKLLREYRTVTSIAKESSETLSERIGISRELASKVILECRKFTTEQRRRR